MDATTLVHVKERVAVAQNIVDLEHSMNAKASKKNWLQKMAKEADLLVDDEYVVLYTVSLTVNQRMSMNHRGSRSRRWRYYPLNRI